MEYIVMDMEWNQALTFSEMVKDPVFLTGEIIQIGAIKVVVKRLVYALTDELRTDYQQCMEQAAAWSKYVIPAYSF